MRAFRINLRRGLIWLGMTVIVASTLPVCAAVQQAGAAPTGTLTIAAPLAPNSLDPSLVAQSLVLYTELAYDSLTYLGSNGVVQPDLATSWSYGGKDNSVFRMNLRPGVTFLDGSKVTASAVQASLTYAKNGLGGQAHALAQVSSIDVTGPLSLSLHLSSPDPILPLMLSQAYGIGQIISPNAVANPSELSVSNPSAGSGPYVFDPSESVAGDHYTYTARSGYWDKARQHFKKIVIEVIANPQAAVNALQTGQVNVVYGGDSATGSQVKSAGLRITAIPFVFTGLDLLDRSGAVSKPLGNVLVRQAINYALNRKVLTNAVLPGYGVPTDTTVIRGSDGWSSAAADYYSYNPAKAKQLLAEAGYPNGFTLPVLSIVGGIDTMAQAMAGELAQVGITLQIKTDSSAQSYVTDAGSLQYPALAIGYGAQSIFQEGQGLFLPTAGLFNSFKSSSPYLANLYTLAVDSTNPKARAMIDQKIESYLVSNAWFALVAFSPVFYFSQKTVQGVDVSGGAPVSSPLDWYIGAPYVAVSSIAGVAVPGRGVVLRVFGSNFSGRPRVTSNAAGTSVRVAKTRPNVLSLLVTTRAGTGKGVHVLTIHFGDQVRRIRYSVS